MAKMETLFFNKLSVSDFTTMYDHMNNRIDNLVTELKFTREITKLHNVIDELKLESENTRLLIDEADIGLDDLKKKLNEVIETQNKNSELERVQEDLKQVKLDQVKLKEDTKVKFELVESEFKMIEDKIDQKVDRLDISVIVNNTQKLRDMIAKFDLNSEEKQILTISKHIDNMKLDLKD